MYLVPRVPLNETRAIDAMKSIYVVYTVLFTVIPTHLYLFYMTYELVDRKTVSIYVRVFYILSIERNGRVPHSVGLHRLDGVVLTGDPVKTAGRSEQRDALSAAAGVRDFYTIDPNQ